MPVALAASTAALAGRRALHRRPRGASARGRAGEGEKGGALDRRCRFLRLDVDHRQQRHLRAIGATLNGVDNRVSLSGHTDATRYSGGERGFSNWELSANRANASRRELVAGGLAEGKMVRVVGLADTLPLDPANPNLPINRRISIIVLNKQAEAAMRGDTKKLEVSADTELEASDIRAGLKAGARPVGPSH